MFTNNNNYTKPTSNFDSNYVRFDKVAVNHLFVIGEATGTFPTSSVLGPTGATGIAGPLGPQGYRGPIGLQGPQGESGPPGDFGPQGSQGPIGQQGPVGPIGPQGRVGPQGSQGSQGSQGTQGPPGSTVNTGATGATGVAGPVGPTGPSKWTETSTELYYIDKPVHVNALEVSQTGGGVIGNLLPLEDNKYNLGAPDRIWHSLYVGTGTIFIGDTTLSSKDGALSIVGGITIVNPEGGNSVSLIPTSSGLQVATQDPYGNMATGESTSSFGSTGPTGASGIVGPTGPIGSGGGVMSMENFELLSTNDLDDYNYDSDQVFVRTLTVTGAFSECYLVAGSCSTSPDLVNLKASYVNLLGQWVRDSELYDQFGSQYQSFHVKVNKDQSRRLSTHPEECYFDTWNGTTGTFEQFEPRHTLLRNAVWVRQHANGSLTGVSPSNMAGVFLANMGDISNSYTTLRDIWLEPYPNYNLTYIKMEFQSYDRAGSFSDVPIYIFF